MKEYLDQIIDDIKSDPKTFLIILVIVVTGASFLLAISLIFGYSMTSADIPCGLIACFILSITFHQYTLYSKGL
ncbi:MAG: hypothetical protein K1X68_14110 [Saprospiraceae bacterium]|nr:hypothetical protein [Saprospiraceae bacterium]HMW38583.1 hypothetical protein [Saprospiraceae bacterium]HMX88784.1 hypothetical protein [Saprospiraceae bacterium]HMZ40484.1 hypothetical protein [Saprospiraceae bacterium]HNA64736.1 hypothetical protein [Saprospiraceae bacterium]